MVKTTLVATELSIGGKIVSALNDAGLSLSAALWFYPPEYEDWRFVLASRKLDAAGEPGEYRLVHDALNKAGISYDQTPTLMILKMNDPFIKALRKTFGKVTSAEGMRWGMQMMGNRWMEEAFIYLVR